MSSSHDRAIKLIQEAAEILEWNIAVPQDDENGNIGGIVVGTYSFLEEALGDLKEYDVFMYGLNKGEEH